MDWTMFLGDRFYLAVADAKEAKMATGSRCLALLPIHYAARDDRWKWQESAKKPRAIVSVPVRRATVTGYVPLSVHSVYSFLNSTLTIDAIVALAKQRGLPAIALADTGHLHGAVEFTQAAKRAGIKPILGATVLVESQPARLYVQNATGYYNLCRLLSTSTVRIGLQQLSGGNNGLLAVSADKQQHFGRVGGFAPCRNP
jgi:PHP domain